MSVKDTAKLSTKFHISIPKSVRTPRRWLAGQEFAFIPKGEGVLLGRFPNSKTLPVWRAVRTLKVIVTRRIGPEASDADV